jgi:hypothetical protein
MKHSSFRMGLGAAAFALLVPCLAPTSAVAQRVPFERTFTVSPGTVLDVSTLRGAIDVSVGSTQQVIVRGSATVRLGLNVPANALELAQKVAKDPPVVQEGAMVRLRPPSGGDEQRAMTLSYRVTVPAGTEVRSETDSGATSIAGVAGPVSVKTQSSAVRLDDVAGDVDVRTHSGRIVARGLGGALRVRTQSGGVDARFTERAHGQSDVETSSSGIDLVGVRGGLTVSSQSGRVRVSGTPEAAWQTTVGSSSIELLFDRTTKLTLDATSGSGDVYLKGLRLDDASASKGSLTGTIGGGGPLVRASTRSGSVKVGLGPGAY